MDFKNLNQPSATPKKGRWLLIGSVVAVLGVVGVILWKRNKAKKTQEAEAKMLADAEALALANQTEDETKPYVKPSPTPQPSVTRKPIEQVADNLGAQAKVYTDKVTASITLADKSKATAVFYANGQYQLYTINPSLKILAKGAWSDGGKQIILSNKRIIRSGSVWSNIRTSVAG